MNPIFSWNKDINKNSYLNWRTSPNSDIRNLLVLAEGYANSSIELAKLCLDDNGDKRADMLIFPIFANCNHAIELYLKAISWMLNILIESESKIEGGHNLKQILSMLKSKINTYEGPEALKSFCEHNKDLDAYIEELFSITKSSYSKDNMDFSRYPLSNKYNSHFYVDELSNVVVDIENFVVRFEKIFSALEDCVNHYYFVRLKGDY